MSRGLFQDWLGMLVEEGVEMVANTISIS